MGWWIFILPAGIHYEQTLEINRFGDLDLIFKILTGQIMSGFSLVMFVGMIYFEQIDIFSSNLEGYTVIKFSWP